MAGEEQERLEAELSALLRRIRLVAFDFDGVFTDNAVYVHQDGTEMVRCTRADGLGLEKLRQVGIETVIISTETNPIVNVRSAKLKTKCIQGCSDKRATLQELVAELGFGLDEVAFVGNDINDLGCMRSVALPIVVSDAHPDVVPYARYRTRLAGGQGAVREVCDLISRSRSGQ